MPGPLYKPVEVDRIRDYVCYYVETKGVRDMAVLAAKDPLLSRRTASGLERRIYRLLEGMKCFSCQASVTLTCR